ncbi:MAG: AzlD domain-containing protein [Candidatus Puniceispirillales bacterium]
MAELWLLVLLAFLGTFGWRLLGVVVGNRIDPESRFSIWINAVAYAMVSGVMMLIVVFPNGLVAETSLNARLAALVLALGVMVWRRDMVIAVMAGLAAYAAVAYFPA